MQSLTFRNWLAMALGLGLGLSLMGCVSLGTSEGRGGGDDSMSASAPAKASSSVVKQVAPANRKRLAVLPILDASGSLSPEMRERIRQAWMRELGVISLAVDGRELASEKFLVGNEYKLQELAQSLSTSSVAMIAEVRVEKLSAERSAEEVGILRQVKSKLMAQIRVRAVAVRTQKEVINTTKTLSLEDSGRRLPEGTTVASLLQSQPEVMESILGDGLREFVPSLASVLASMEWEGRVAMISGDRIFLNVGQLSGVQIGDILKVSAEGEEISDPRTGRVIGKAPGRVKGTLEVVSYFGQDGAITVVHSGAGFQVNDKVEPY